MSTGKAFRREESLHLFFPVWKVLFPFSPRSTYHSHAASMTSATSECFSLQILGASSSLLISPSPNLCFSLSIKAAKGKGGGGVPAERMMGGQTRVMVGRSKLRRKKPSTHYLRAHLRWLLHAWPQTFHVLWKREERTPTLNFLFSSPPTITSHSRWSLNSAM